MSFIFEIFPVFLFFIVFKWYDIYAATLVGIVSTYVQVVSYRFYTGHWSRQQLVTLGAFLLFGGMTLYLHNPLFIKWKPTIVFWLFSLAILFSQWITGRSFVQRMMESFIEGKATVPAHIWQRLSMMWCVFFLLMGGLNLFIAYQMSDNAWVNFKFYGITTALIICSIIQALYLNKYLTEKTAP